MPPSKPKSARLAHERIHNKSWPTIFSASKQPRSTRKAKLWFTFVAVPDLSIFAEPTAQNRKPPRFPSLRYFRSQMIPEVERCYLKDTVRPMR
jgi:hypothetical protein